jgi:probable biosynthetic protein (TIGR04099 family)
MSLDFVDFNPLRTAADPAATAAIRLGMPHLDCTGLSQDWLFRECCRRHWWAFAEFAGRAPSELTDCQGVRMMASVVVATVRGPLHLFREDDLLSIDMLVAPARETGWRSAWVARSGRGAVVSVELVAVFAKRAGTSNTVLNIADLAHEFLPNFDGAESKRAHVLRARGRSERAAVPEPGAPLFSLPFLAHAHINGFGLMYFANFIDPFEHVERLAITRNFGTYRLASRQIHCFGNVDAGDWLDFDCSLRVAAIAPEAEIVLTSTARRRSDDWIVAVCISTRQVANPGAPS